MIIRNISIRILIRESESKVMTNYVTSNCIWKQTRNAKTKQNKAKKIIANLRQMIILEGLSKKLPFEYQSQKRPLISSSLHLAAVISFQNPPRYIKQIYSQNHKHYQIL